MPCAASVPASKPGRPRCSWRCRRYNCGTAAPLSHNGDEGPLVQLVLEAAELLVRLQHGAPGLRVEIAGAIAGVARAVARRFHLVHALREDFLVLRLLRLAHVAVEFFHAFLQVARRAIIVLEGVQRAADDQLDLRKFLLDLLDFHCVLLWSCRWNRYDRRAFRNVPEISLPPGERLYASGLGDVAISSGCCPLHRPCRPSWPGWPCRFRESGRC